MSLKREWIYTETWTRPVSFNGSRGVTRSTGTLAIHDYVDTHPLWGFRVNSATLEPDGKGRPMQTVDTTEVKWMTGYVDAHAWITTASADEIGELVDAVRENRVVIIRPRHSLARFWNRPRKTTSENEIIGFVDPMCVGYDRGFIAALRESFPDLFTIGA